MKKIILLFAAAILTIGGYAQRSAFVNTETVFKALPEYNKALSDIDDLAKSEQAKIDAEYDRIAEMFDRYQAQRQNLSEASRKQVEDNIVTLERNAADMQSRIFGADGEIMKKRMDLLKPIQDRVFKALDGIATSKGYDMVTDISNNPAVVYYNKSLDLTNDVLKSLGINK